MVRSVWSLTVAIAGFLFGFDTIVISGADKPIQQLWQTTPLFHGTFIMSMALWGTVLGALTGGIPAKKIGRKKNECQKIVYIFRKNIENISKMPSQKSMHIR